jgi:hypothetical protein
MEARDLIDRMERQATFVLDREDLPKLLDIADTIRADDTRLSGWIRILSIGGRLVIQEETPEGEIVLRRLASRQDAEDFVERRLADYDRMWDGCGCRIDYHG